MTQSPLALNLSYSNNPKAPQKSKTFGEVAKVMVRWVMVKYVPTNVHKISTADSSGRYMQWLVHYKMYVFCKTFISYFNSSVGNKLWSILWVLPRWIGSVFSFKTTDLLKNCFEVFDLLKSFWIQRLYMRKNLLHQKLSWI